MTKALRLGAMTAAVGLVLAALVYVVAASNQQIRASQKGANGAQGGSAGGEQAAQKLGIGDLASSCASSVGKGGFGEVKIDRKVIVSNEEGEIPVPCRVVLARGGELALNKVRLKTKNLIVTDRGANGENRVRVENSTVTASGRFGFLMQLSDREDRLDVRHSTFDYPLSFWVRIQGRDRNAYGGGRVAFTASEVRSLDPESEGIQLIASDVGEGVGRFVGLKLRTVEFSPGVQNALLLAENCVTERVEGLAAPCGPNDERQDDRP